MNSLFSEVYGLYYMLTAKILREAPIGRARMEEIVREGGFGETLLELLPPLLDGTWPLLEEQNGLYHSRLRHPPSTPLTTLERRWLATIACDPRMALFLTPEHMHWLLHMLGHPEPLFSTQHVRYYDQALDGDDYASLRVRRIFRTLLAAVRTHQMVRIHYHSPRRGLRAQHVLPLKLEYSMRDDKFRLLCVHPNHKGSGHYRLLNLQRMEGICVLEEKEPPTGNLHEWHNSRRCDEPITVVATTARNTLERFMMEFSFCEKESVYDEERQVCHVRIWYRKEDEMEMVIRLLSFGPTIRVTGPGRVVEEIRRRVQRQYALLEDADSIHAPEKSI
ncbi:MAG: WYL domain-containing protein [Clostridiales bacterium]|nr:WYL domain-containing protein [Clostridiales bacterium]